MFEFLLSGLQTILLNPGWSLFLVLLWVLVVWWFVWIIQQEGGNDAGKGLGMFLMGVVTLIITFAVMNVLETPSEYQQTQMKAVKKMLPQQRPNMYNRAMYNRRMTRI